MLLTDKTKNSNGATNSLNTTGNFQILDNSLGSHDLNNYSVSKSRSQSSSSATSKASSAVDPNGSFSKANQLGTLHNSRREYGDIGYHTSYGKDKQDFWKFRLNSNRDVTLSLSGLSEDAGLAIYDSSKKLISWSNKGGNASEFIRSSLSKGDYYALVYKYSGNSTNYTLTTNLNLSKYVSGNLRANTFSLDSRYDKMIFSGNGNVDYGTGQRDILNLSSISSKSVKFNYASIYGGGVLYNPGKGSRVFDAVTLSNGKQILFEGIEKISFRDRTINLSVKPNDPLFKKQWNLHMTGVHNAWRFTKGSSKVLVGIQDTGLGTNSRGFIHSDLRRTTIYKNNYRDEFFRTFKGKGYGRKLTSHGTPVQGIIGAASNNGWGMSGINWNSRVFNVDVLDGNKNDQSLTKATQKMINEASRNGQRLVINMSLSGGSISSAFEKLIARNQKNALFVMSSGNNNRNSLSDPASLSSKYSNVISVGASWGTRDTRGNSRIPGTRISYSGWWGSNYGNGLTLMAPSEVYTTNAKRNPSGIVQFGYDSRFSGTSAAAPHVTGIASLVWSVNSRLSATQIKSILSQTAYNLGARGYDKVYGHGFVNADAAVRRAMALARGAA
ncbi:subtilisin-like serine protease [Rivularia sp. PCC 7116]|uniref:S8 family serine peptidase n=1 Tax=Rivularia sp. PCC 7116 TaxID=373994 RepID=UPI00029F1B73|nr:S8 family serine peptidase [Rivularia sp. PCC 7116]AFY57426.1 subtilisin-like serine protease [Rivularia sp. PCC 7116]